MPHDIFPLSSWPRAIVHVDGDAFFTSCEEAIHPELRGRPLITGAERGIVSCASYAAKRAGVQRGVSLWDAKKLCPGLVVLPSDYETYSLFSERMFAILRRFTPQVEPYSIDEAFADITGLRRLHAASYATIVMRMKAAVRDELGITVSAGLSLSKVLAKAASKHRKPDGLTCIPGRSIAAHLEDLPVEKIWGIGPATTHYLAKLGMRTALALARLPEATVTARLTKPGVEIWRELRGASVWPVTAEAKETRASISKTKTFAPPSADRDYLFAHLLRNLESACLKAREYDLAALRIVAILKTQTFDTTACEAKLNRASAYPAELTRLLRNLFDALWRPRVLYRATGIVLADLHPEEGTQGFLFDDPVKAQQVSAAYRAVDDLNARYGKHTVHLGGSHLLEVRGKGRRGEATAREKTHFPGERGRRHIGLPLIHVKV